MVTAEATVTYSSGRAMPVPGEASSPPDIRLIHYNDVYHIDSSSSEPVGGVARFVSMCKEYREGQQFKGQPDVVTLFSGDVFNPSLESSVTKGSFGHLILFPWKKLTISREPHGPPPQHDRNRLRLCRGKPCHLPPSPPRH